MNTPDFRPEMSLPGYRSDGYESDRYNIGGDVDTKAVTSGRLANGEWILLVPFSSWSGTMIYRWHAGRAVPVGSLRGVTERASISFDDGAIALRQPLYAPLGPCRRTGLEIRRFRLENGRLLEFERFAKPHGAAITVTSEFPSPKHAIDGDPFSGVPPAEFAARTPGLYRICFQSLNGQPDDQAYGGQPYYGSDGPLWGIPIMIGSEVFRASDGTWLIALPYGSGGSAGVLDAAVYRLERRHLVLVRVIDSRNGLHLSFSGGHLRVHSPIGGSWNQTNFLRETTFDYNPTSATLRATDESTIPSVSFSDYRRLHSLPSPSPVPSPWPF
ncbi:MAG TPA: hypothetical protein VKG44_06185 [Candidatus Baltobacteraceae bacterium]|nr:hypothetical protein [Candidatus Baltobacteraceae bacterium]